MRKNVACMSVEEFLREYFNFLVNNGLSENAAKVYTCKIRKLLNNGYTVADLCGSVEWLIDRHGRGGADYDPKDHGNVYNALKWLWRFLQDGIGSADPEQKIFISYRAGWSSFRPVNKHMVAYSISGRTITVQYNRSFSPAGSETKTIPDSSYRRLIDIMSRYASCLADSDTLIKTVHGAIHEYEYSFGDRAGSRCGCLFDDDSAMAEYQDWLAPFVK